MGRTAKPCLFCAIVRGEADAHRVYEDAATLGFLDFHPLARGHVLLVPKVHVTTLFEADVATVNAMAGAAQRLAVAVRAARGADGVFVAQNNVVSQSVPHLHTHVVPRWRDDRLFSPALVWKRIRYASPTEMDEVAASIRGAVSR
jgi:histidine triad (HIT) family protein